MISDINSILNNQLINDNRFSSKDNHKKISLAQVDALADELVNEYDNPEFRSWYCGVINKFGLSKVHEWMSRAKSGQYPGRLFTTYVNQAGGYKKDSLK